MAGIVPETVTPRYTTEEIVREYEGSNYSERMASLARLGRVSRTDKSVAATIILLSEGNLYQRVMALQTCYGSRDTQLPLQALKDPSEHMQKLAVRLVVALASDEEIMDAATTMPTHILKTLLPKLKSAKRRLLVDTILYTLEANDREVMLRLLPYGSTALAGTELKQNFFRSNSYIWKRLAKLHPRLVVDKVLTDLNDSAECSSELVEVINVTVPLLIKQFEDGEAIQQMLQRIATVGKLNHIAKTVQKALDRFPVQTIHAMLNAATLESFHLNWRKTMKRVDLAQLLALHRKWPHFLREWEFECVMREVSPTDKLFIFNTFESRWRRPDGSLSMNIVAKLPPEQRIEEVRYQVSLPANQQKVANLAAWKAMLPWDEAMAMQSMGSDPSNLDLRSAALRSQISRVQYNQNAIPHALDLIIQRRAESDVGRHCMLQGLDTWTSDMFRPEYLPRLDTIIRNCLESVDLSHKSAKVLVDVVAKCFIQNPEWAIGQFLQLWLFLDIHYTNRVDLRKASGSSLTYVDDKLASTAQDLLDRKKFQQLLELETNIRRPSGSLRKFDAVLAKYASSPTSELPSSKIFGFLKTQQPDTKKLVRQLIHDDKSWITDKRVKISLQKDQQTLLTQFLDGGAFPGRFDNGGATSLPIFNRYLFRWTASQQDRYASAIVKYIQGLEHMGKTARIFLRLLGSLHFSQLAGDSLIAMTTDERPLLRNIAVQCLTRLDEGKGVSTMLQALEDDRARTAAYSLYGIINRMDKDVALKALSSVDTKQISIHKEIVRMIGDLKTDKAYNYLLDTVRSTETHIDVRIAALRRLWDYPQRDDLSNLFIEGIKDCKTDAASMLLSIRPFALTDAQNVILLEMVRAGIKHSAVEIRNAALRRCTTYPLHDPDKKLPADLIEIVVVNNAYDAEAAANAVIDLYLHSEPLLIANLFEKLTHDKPRFQMLYNCLPVKGLMEPKYSRSIQQILSVLQQQGPVYLNHYIGLLFRSVPTDQVVSTLHVLLPEQSPGTIHDILQLVEKWLNANLRNDLDLPALQEALRKHEHENCRLVGYNIFKQYMYGENDWSPEMLQALEEYRNDACSAIARAAAWQFAPKEKVDAKEVPAGTGGGQ